MNFSGRPNIHVLCLEAQNLFSVHVKFCSTSETHHMQKLFIYSFTFAWIGQEKVRAKVSSKHIRAHHEPSQAGDGSRLILTQFSFILTLFFFLNLTNLEKCLLELPKSLILESAWWATQVSIRWSVSPGGLESGRTFLSTLIYSVILH